MSNRVSIGVGTDMLRALVESNPEVMLQLQALASEKIAEEIVRKVKLAAVDEMKTRAEGEFSRILSETTAAYTAKWKFPREAEVAIGTKVREVTELYFSQQESVLSNKLDKALAARLETAIDSITSRLIPIIQQHARTEFVSVLREIQTATKV